MAQSQDRPAHPASSENSIIPSNGDEIKAQTCITNAFNPSRNLKCHKVSVKIKTNHDKS
jgi:hypothetical protein